MLYDEKKQEIIDVSIDLFAEHGTSEVSVARIAEEIGVTRGMVYYHFKKGKAEIVDAILEMYEKNINNYVPNHEEWASKDADAKEILFKLFFRLSAGDMLKFRKIVRIVLSEMYHNEQIRKYAVNYFIDGRESLLAHCFTVLAHNRKIAPLDAESAARYFNRNLLAYAIEDALRYPYIHEKEKEKAQWERMLRDFTTFISIILSKTSL